MYTVMIAEDELLVRMGIASSVPWMQMDMRVIAETTDGESALKAFQQFHPDIVITDIRMPKIDGLELIRRIRAEDKDCAIIVVTNVEHEDIVNEARRNGVVHFLMKASMKRDDITSAVRKASESLPKERRVKTMLFDNHDLWREYLTSPQMTPEMFYQRCVEINSAHFYPQGLIYMHIVANECLSHRLIESLINLFSHKLDSANNFCVVRFGNDAVALSRNAFDVEMMDRNLRDMARYVRDNFGSELIFVIMPHASEISRLRHDFETARRYIQFEAFFDQSTLQLDAEGYPFFDELREISRKLNYCTFFSNDDSAFSDCANMIMDLPKALNANWASGKNLGMRMLAAMDAPQECTGVHGMIDAISFAVEQAFQRICMPINATIFSAIEYIEEHISEKISIRQVSDMAGYHPAYFSILFKRETGMNFQDFLTLIRIHRAKDLLKTRDASLQEIAASCGFADLSYFSNKFKLATGMSPSQWRSKK